MNKSERYMKSVFNLFSLSFLFGFPIGLGFFYPSLGIILGVSISFGFIYQYYQNYQKQKKMEFTKKLETLEFDFAKKRFEKTIEKICEENLQINLMIDYYTHQILDIQRSILNLFPKEKLIDNAIMIYKKKTPAPSDEWLNFTSIYRLALDEYPTFPKIADLPPKIIHRHCNLFDEYHQKVRFFSEQLEKKGSECFRQYEQQFINFKR